MITSDRSSLFLWLTLIIIFPKEKLHSSGTKKACFIRHLKYTTLPRNWQRSVTAFTFPCNCTLVICVLYAPTIQYSTVFFFSTHNWLLPRRTLTPSTLAFSKKAICASRSYEMFSLVSITRPLTDSSLGASPLFVQQRVRACSQATTELLRNFYIGQNRNGSYECRAEFTHWK